MRFLAHQQEVVIPNPVRSPFGSPPVNVELVMRAVGPRFGAEVSAPYFQILRDKTEKRAVRHEFCGLHSLYPLEIPQLNTVRSS